MVYYQNVILLGKGSCSRTGFNGWIPSELNSGNIRPEPPDSMQEPKKI